MFYFCGALLSIAVAVWIYCSDRSMWLFGVMLVAVLANAWESLRYFTTRVVLGDAELLVLTFRKKELIERGRIAKVTWEKGCGVAVQLDGATWSKIPDQGNAQGMCALIRNWAQNKPNENAPSNRGQHSDLNSTFQSPLG